MTPGRSIAVYRCHGDPLLTVDGVVPVWPVDDDTCAALLEIAPSWGFDLVEVDRVDRVHSTGATDPEQSGGLGMVVGVGLESAPHAALYAHLTGRRWMVVEDLDELPDPDHVAIVLGEGLELTSRALDALYDPRLERAVGLLISESQDDMRRLVRTRAVTMRMGGDGRSRRVDIVPGSPMVQRDDDTAAVLGAGADTARLRAALSDARAVTTVFTHSDGLDADLGPGNILCPVDEAWQQPWERPPTCRATSFCYRAGGPTSSVASQLIHPSALAARVLVFNTCVGITPADSNVAARYGLGVRLAANHRVGALITSWRPTIGTYRSSIPLTRLLLSGTSLGAAVAASNRLHDELGTGLRFCLVGDPEASAVPVGSTPPSDPEFDVRRLTAATERDPGAGDMGFLRACLTSLSDARRGSAPGLGELAPVVTAALTAIDSLAESAVNPVAAQEMRKAVVSVFAQRGRVCDIWLGQAKAYRAALRSRCEGCSNTAVEYSVELVTPGTSARLLEICPRCGFVRDHPEDWAIGLAVESAGAVRLTRFPRQLAGADRHCWAGELAVRYRDPLPHHRQPWPAGPDGLPVETLECTRPLLAAPVVVTATFVVKDQLLQAGRAIIGSGGSLGFDGD